MLAEFQFFQIPVFTMSNSDRKDDESENSPIPTSIPLIGSPVTVSISNTPKFKIPDSVSMDCIDEVGDETDQNDDELRNSAKPTSISPIGSPITASISNTPNLEIQGSASRFTEEARKRRRLGEEIDRNDDGLRDSPTPTSNSPVGSPNIASISSSPRLEIQYSVSHSTDKTKKRRHLGEEVEPTDEGFTTPTDLDHRIPVPAKCPPAPRKPSSRKSKSPPDSATETRRNIFPVDVSDEETESFFPSREQEP